MKKKLISFFLITLIVVSSVFCSYEKAYAFVGIDDLIVGTTAAITAPEALAIGCVVAGVCATYYIYDHWNEIEDNFIKMNSAVGQWIGDVQEGVIDVGSSAFEDVKDWSSDLLNSFGDVQEGVRNGIYVFNGNQTFGYLDGTDRSLSIEGTVGLQAFGVFNLNDDVSPVFVSDSPFYINYFGSRVEASVDNVEGLGEVYYKGWHYGLDCCSGVDTFPYLSDGFKAVFDEVFGISATDVFGLGGVEGLNEGEYTDVVSTGSIANTGTWDGTISIPSTADIPTILTGVQEGTMSYAEALEQVGACEVVREADTDVVYEVDKSGKVNRNTKHTVPKISPTVSGNENYKAELKDIFPFCIPFDLRDLIKKLSATRKAPQFKWQIAGEEFKINLSKFDDVAAIFRSLIVILFCVGLALKTRSLIRG